MVVVAGGWPSSLVAVLQLDLPLAGAFFPAAYHRYFKSRHDVTWHQIGDFNSSRIRGQVFFILSGSVSFLESVMPWLGGNCDRLIISVEFERAGLSRKALRASKDKAARFLSSYDLRMSLWSDELFGGMTDGEHFFGFGSGLKTPALPQARPGLARSVGHILDCAAKSVEGTYIPKTSVPTMIGSPRKPVWYGSVLLPHGLFPTKWPKTNVMCPSVYKKGHFISRPLVMKEALRVYQLPLAYDTRLLSNFNVTERLPFESVPPPDMFADILRQLWGSNLRGVKEVREAEGQVDPLPAKDPTIAGQTEKENMEGSRKDQPRGGASPVEPEPVSLRSVSIPGPHGDTLLQDGLDKSLGSLAPSCAAGVSDGVATQVKTDMRVMTALSVSEPPQDATLSVAESDHTPVPELLHRDEVSTSSSDETPMRASTCDNEMNNWEDLIDGDVEETGDERIDEESIRGIWEFDFGPSLAPIFNEGSTTISHDDTLTSAASAETWITSHLECGAKSVPVGSGMNPGPPFAVGDVVSAEPTGKCIQRAYVLEADHPAYKIRLEDGSTLDTSETPTALIARYAPGQFAEDNVAIFNKLRDRTDLNHGSFGVRVDSQKYSLQRLEEEKQHAKAVKSDDAEVPVYLWNERIKTPGITKERRDRGLLLLRRIGFRLFLNGLRHDCALYLAGEFGSEWMSSPREQHGKSTKLGRDLAAIQNLIWHATHTNWFEYKAGSRLVFFRFPIRYQKIARDGVPIYFETAGPSTRDAQPSIRDPERRAKVRTKLEKVIKRRYMLTTGLKIRSLIKYFDVPKGDDDIRMVYDATANQLNSCVWAPSFWLPTVETLVRALDSSSWMTDRDIADMFLNFQLDRKVVPFTGVDLTPMYGDGEKVDPKWACWDRLLMGLGPSPHNAVKMALIVEEIAKGDRHDTRLAIDGSEKNPFQWSSVRLNLPGTISYNPSVTWICKLRRDKSIASDIFTFVDDERVTGATRELTWQASHRLAAIQSYLGVQDAARKVRPCSQTPGAWAGAVVHIFQALGVCTLTSTEKWIKLKALLKKWWDLLESGETELAHKELLSDRGFMVYVTRTYPSMIPYLKGFHLTIEMWRGGRDAEGWKLKEGDDSSITSVHSLDSLDVTRAGAHGKNLGIAGSYSPDTAEDEDGAALNHRLARLSSSQTIYAPPSGLTTAVPRLIQDVAALRQLSDFDLPPLRVVRPTETVQVFYGFGDASGKQFGSTISENYNCKAKLSQQQESPGGLRYRVGVWTAEESLESSNYKELGNLVESTEEETAAGRLQNCEFFLFTDNSTAESCYYRGSSKSSKLHGLVLRLRLLEMNYGLLVHIIHVSGKRMIAQGTDGCSRGSLMEGVMTGLDMLTFIDLSKTATERHPPLLNWIRGWTGCNDLEPLTPEGWFEEAHGVTGGALDRNKVWIPTHGPANKLFLWAPQPAVADAALEELLKARHKRSDTFHVVVLPRLMTPRWRRLFNKACDFSFVVPPETSFWPANMFEPLWVGILLPFVQHRPWCLKRTPLLVELGSSLRGMLPSREEDAGNLLRELLRLPRRLAPLSERVARGVLHLPGEGIVPNV